MRIRFLDKTKADEILPELFRILYDNMEPIAPTGDSYEDGLSLWLSCVKPALAREQRQILLLTDGEKIAGFFQYYVNGGVFMMEEIQFRAEYRGTGLFETLYRHLVGIIPADTEFVEAYAHKNNAKSMAVLAHMGLSIIGENKNGISWHYRGRYKTIARRYGRSPLTE